MSDPVNELFNKSYILLNQQLDKAIKVTISDNGIGFDTAVLDTLDETHVGIRNVQSR